MEKSILLAYIITLISEIVIILSIQKPKKIWQWVLVIVLINSFTHPIAIYFLHVQNVPYIVVELGVFIIESIWYKFVFHLSWKRSVVLSAIANLFSILVGIVIRFLLGL